MSNNSNDDNIYEDYEDYEEKALSICDKIYSHVNQCKHCQRRMSFDPVEKALLKTHSIKNEILELVAFLALGVLIIFVLRIRR